MSGPHEVYISDGHGTLTKLTPRLAAEAMANFWEDQHIERIHMSGWQNGQNHPGQDMQGKHCNIVLADGKTTLNGDVVLASAPFIIVREEDRDLHVNVNHIMKWYAYDKPDNDGIRVGFLD